MPFTGNAPKKTFSPERECGAVASMQSSAHSCWIRKFCVSCHFRMNGQQTLWHFAMVENLINRILKLSFKHHSSGIYFVFITLLFYSFWRHLAFTHENFALFFDEKNKIWFHSNDENIIKSVVARWTLNLNTVSCEFRLTAEWNVVGVMHLSDDFETCKE